MNVAPELIAKVKAALSEGPIRAYGGGIVCHPNPGKPALCNTTQLYHVIQALHKEGIKVGRTDSGGAPTWAIEV